MTRTGALFIIGLLATAAQAQVTWVVQVGGSTAGGAPPYYSPAFLTIMQGDTVRWNWVSGTHNVNGTQVLFSSNPASFNSGNPVNAPHTFNFVFTVPGVYQYECTQTNHAATQHGQITVTPGTTGLSENSPWGELQLFPVPAGPHLTVSLDLPVEGLEAMIIGADGRIVKSYYLGAAQRNDLWVGDLPAGLYFLRLSERDGHTFGRSFVKQ